jgi:hypothetical protein
MFESARADQSDDLNHPERHGYSKKQIEKAIKEKKKSINVNAITKDIAYSFEAQDKFASAQYTDEALENIITGIVAVLRQKGFNRDADTIESEYYLKFQGAVSKVVALKEIGSHEPLSQWLLDVHNKVHDLIGEFLCKMTRVHDIWTLSYAIPVMFAPSKYSQEEYRDHFHGHRWIGWIWVHRGGVPIITYWVINGVCGGLTYGMGWVTFVCGPISGFGQTIMEDYFSEDLSDFVWTRANNI